MTATKTRTSRRSTKPSKNGTHGKKAKLQRAARGEIDIAAVERDLIKRYPHIVPGSLRLPGTHDDYPAKRSVEIACRLCGKHRRIATQDAFQVKFCGPVCKREAKKAAKSTKS